MDALSPWIAYCKPKPKRKIRLFCFPYAGGAASVFARWHSFLPDSIEVCPIQLPGRENRLSEAPYSHVPDVVCALKKALLPFCQEPFAFLGYSLGNLLAFELARRLEEEEIFPLHFFVAAHRAPHIPYKEKIIHSLPDLLFLQEIMERYNNIPQEVLTNKEYLDLILPGLRADYTMVETYQYEEAKPIQCSITAFGGQEDPTTSQKDLLAWKQETQGNLRVFMLPGDHFFIKLSLNLFLGHIQNDLDQYLHG
ncbi:MAG: thioesterase [Candidatus Brocadiae bacterium]|nr:thioesterase [Candidatus Brocadiia bacterium]